RQQLAELAREEGLPETLRPEVLFALARASYEHYGANVEEHFEELVDALEAAINADPESSRVPWALLHLGLVHLKAGNVPEATGHFNMLQERFPEHPLIPSSWVLYGQTYLDAGAFQAAADHFEHVVTVYPEHDQALPARVGLATALKELGFFEQALAMVRFVEDNWPDHYLSSPGFLRLAGFVAQQLGDFDMARDRYWTNFNLEPGAEGADVVLTRLGDIFLMMEQKEAAKEVYEKAAQDFPDQEGGLVARIRLAEEGINDQPTVQGMFSIFDRSFTLRPRQVYTDIIENHPDSPVAPMAQVKLGIWYVFNNKSKQALELADAFLKDNPSSTLAPRMLEVGHKAYRQYALAQVEEGNYERVVEVWSSSAYLEEGLDALDPQAILSTALCCWKTGEVSRARDLAMPFLTGERRFVPDSESALDLMLSIYIEGHAWDKVLELGEAMSGRDMSQERRTQLTYARALAFENLGHKEKSTPLWEDLATDPNLSVKQKGFAYYFLARDAMRQQDLQSAQLLAKNGLSALIQSNGDRAKALDLLDLLISVSERSGRKLDALSWGMELEKQLSPDDELWPAFRYRLAGLYKNSGDTQKWIDILQSLESNHPDVMYGRMAASDLRNHELGQRAAQYY
ncbi:MAG: tetratricopeptide repeat protein, partial [Desulfohalobiaceae bacterium]